MPTYIHFARRLRCADPGADAQRAAEDEIIDQARDILIRRLGQTVHAPLNSPAEVRTYLKLTLMARPAEEFWCVMLDAQHRVMSAEMLFAGTLTQTSVYPREVVKAALARNAAAIIFAHNHPSGVAEPSHADELLTRALKQALAIVDVNVLDHFIVAGDRILSFAERGLL